MDVLRSVEVVRDRLLPIFSRPVTSHRHTALSRPDSNPTTSFWNAGWAELIEECSGNEIRSLNSRINILFKICVLYDKNHVKKNRETVGVSWAPWSMNCPVWNRFFVEISVFTEWTSLSSIQSDSKSLPIFFYLVFYVIWVRFQRIWDRDDQSLYLAATTLPANVAGFETILIFSRSGKMGLLDTLRNAELADTYKK